MRQSRWTKLIFLATSLTALPAASVEPVLLGQSAVFSGVSGALGGELWKGAQAYFDRLNLDGGLHGRPVEVISLDHRYEGDMALAHTLSFASDPRIFALFGYVGTSTFVRAMPAIQRYEREDLFLFSSFGGTPSSSNGRQVLNVRPSLREETEALVDHLSRNGFRRVGLFLQDDAYGRAGADGIARALGTRGLEVVREVTYRRETPFGASFGRQVELLRKVGADVIISVGFYAPCAGFIRDARRTGLEAPIVNLSLVNSDALLALLSTVKATGGGDLTRKLINVQVVPSWEDLSYPLVRGYRRDVDRMTTPFPAHLTGQLPASIPAIQKYGTVGLEGYLNAKVFSTIAARVQGPLSRKSFLAEAIRTRELEVGLGQKLRFGNSFPEGLRAFFFMTVEGGKSVAIKDWGRLK